MSLFRKAALGVRDTSSGRREDPGSEVYNPVKTAISHGKPCVSHGGSGDWGTQLLSMTPLLLSFWRPKLR